jgi:hypothetical protein
MKISHHLFLMVAMPFMALAGTLTAQDCERVERRMNSIRSGFPSYFKSIDQAKAVLADAEKSGNRARIAAAQQRLNTVEANLEASRQNLYSLTTWYDNNCGINPAFLIIGGRWRSTEGDADVTQSGSKVTITVHYPTGGTSTLTGQWQRKDYLTFTWRNTRGHHGTGGLTMVTDPARPGVVTRMNGWWIDKSLTPFNRGNWSLWQ